jgi:N,N'-diacetylchitobiose transport system permease protein
VTTTTVSRPAPGPADSDAAAALAAREAHRRRVRLSRIGFNGLALVVALLSAFPVYWMVNTSFQRSIEIRNETQLTPLGGTLHNYQSVFDTDNFWSSFGNSIKVTGLTVGVALVCAFFGAVAVSRFRFRGRVGFLIMILVVQMVPSEALMISVVKVLEGWDLRNTIMGLTMVYVAFVLPFTVWTLRGFVAGVPRELEEAAMVDGSSRLRAFFTVTLPLVMPGLVATGIFAFIQAWNEYTFALVIMDRPEKETLPLWLQQFNFGARGTDWGGVMAGSTLITIPVLIFFLLVHRRVAAGLTAGAVKG